MEETPKPPSEELKPEAEPAPSTSPESEEVSTEALKPETPPEPIGVPRAKTRPKPIGESVAWIAQIFGFMALVSLFFMGRQFYEKWVESHPPQATPTPNPYSSTPILQSIGEFSVILKSEQVLRIEIVFQCYDQATCEFIKSNRLKVRDLISPILASMTTENISDIEIKKNLRKKLVSRVNSLSMPGKVFQSFITNLSIEGSTYELQN